MEIGFQSVRSEKSAWADCQREETWFHKMSENIAAFVAVTGRLLSSARRSALNERIWEESSDQAKVRARA